MDRQAIVSTENNSPASNNDSVDDNTNKDTGDNLGKPADTLIPTLAENSRSQSGTVPLQASYKTA